MDALFARLFGQVPILSRGIGDVCIIQAGLEGNRMGGAAEGIGGQVRRATVSPVWHRQATGVGAIFLSCLAAGMAGCPDGTPPSNGNSLECATGSALGVPTVSYAGDVLPILEESGCLSGGCHGGAFPSSDYSMLSYDDVFVAGIQATAFQDCPIVPGDPDGSYLIEKISAMPRSGARMPFLGGPLSEAEIEVVRTWIAEGAPNN